MADPPPVWQIFSADEYAAYEVPAAQDEHLGFHLLMCLSAQHRFTGAFRLCLFGGGELSVTPPLADVLYPLPPEFAHLSLMFVASPREIQLQQNSVSTAWVDVVDMIRDGSALVANGDDVHEDSTPLVAYLLDPATKKANVGASVRWAVAATADKEIRLELQLLPVPARLLNKQNLRQDNAVSVLLKSVRIRTEMFSGGQVLGPVPLLFVPDRQAAANHLQSDPVGVKADIKALNERFLLMEHMSMGEAVAYIQGRHRSAKGTPVFIASSGGTAAPKRARLQAPDTASPGKHTKLTQYLYKPSTCTENVPENSFFLSFYAYILLTPRGTYILYLYCT